MDAEIELLETLIKTCRAIRDPKRPKSRLELAAPAATYEMQFTKRLDELKKPVVPALPKETVAA